MDGARTRTSAAECRELSTLTPPFPLVKVIYDQDRDEDLKYVERLIFN